MIETNVNRHPAVWFYSYTFVVFLGRVSEVLTLFECILQTRVRAF